MRVLALDTTTREGSAALVEDGHVLAEHRADSSRSHAEQLPDGLLSLLARSPLSARDVELFAVAVGPGSFTGLRIGIATMQGLASVTRRPLAGISALEALAQIAAADGVPDRLVAAWVDAQRGEVFSALYRTADAPAWSPHRLVEIDGASVGDPVATLERWRGGADLSAARFVGDGAVRYVDAIRTHAGADVTMGPWLIAGAIGQMAEARSGEAGEPGAIRPLYVRRPDAERARDGR